jgi:hypothetical protein
LRAGFSCDNLAALLFPHEGRSLIYAHPKKSLSLYCSALFLYVKKIHHSIA